MVFGISSSTTASDFASSAKKKRSKTQGIALPAGKELPKRMGGLSISSPSPNTSLSGMTRNTVQTEPPLRSMPFTFPASGVAKPLPTNNYQKSTLAKCEEKIAVPKFDMMNRKEEVTKIDNASKSKPQSKRKDNKSIISTCSSTITSKSEAQKASEAILVQRLLSLLRSDIGIGGLSNGDFTSSLPPSMTFSASPTSFGDRQSNRSSITALSAGASLPSSGMNSPEKLLNKSFFAPDAATIDVECEGVSFEEALEVIRTKLAAKKKKNGLDPLSQLAIVKGILHLAALAADTTSFEIDENSRSLEGGEDELESGEETVGQLLQIDLRPSAEALRAEGMRWLKRLASQTGLGRHPLPEAQSYLASLLRGQGDPRLGIKVNLEKAYALSLHASKQGLADATFWTAVCYEQGMGTRKDADRAITFYRKAASLGHGRAMHRMALILQQGQLGVSPAPKEAFTWLKRAAALGTIPAAIHDLALMYERNGTGNGVAIPDDAYALELFKRAAAMNYAPSQVKLGTCYEYGRLGCSLDAAQSIEWYRRAAELGDPAAELALSGWYLTGAVKEASGDEDPDNLIILPQSDVDAYTWAKRAAERHDARAEYALGRYCELGIGLPAPALNDALYWYGKAAAQGHRKAKKRRSELKKTIKLSASGSMTSSSSLRFFKSILGGKWG